MEYVEVKGNVDDLSNYANIYQKFSSMGSKSIDKVRRQFMDSELEKYQSSVAKGYIEEEVGKVTEVTEVDEVNEEIIESTAHGVVLGDTESKEYVAHGVMLDKEAIPEVHKDYVSHGVFLDKEVTLEVQKDYVSHGVILNKEVTVSRPETKKEYVSHGVLLDEVIAENADTLWSADKLHNVEEEDDLTVLSDGEEDVENPWFDEEESDTGEEPYEEEDVEEPLVYKKKPYAVRRKSFTKEDLMGLFNEEDKTSDVEESVVEKEPVVESKTERPDVRKPRFEKQVVKPKPKPEPVPKKPVKPPEPTVDRTVKVIQTYPNVRAFVKANPGCTQADVLKSFSSGELKKALMSSKIVEKKGKLYAV